MATGEPLRDYYAILGVDPTASPEEIKAAYRERAKRFHPDRAGPGADPARFRLLREAYNVLADPLERAAYDARRRARKRREGRPEAGGGGRRRRPAGDWARWRVWRALAFLGATTATVLALWLWWTETRIGMLERRLRQTTAVGAKPAPGSADTGVGGTIAFRPGATELDRAGEQQLAVLLAQMDRRRRELPADADWHVVIAARVRQAVTGDGPEPAVWDRTLARFGAIAGRLLAAGIPAERIALRFAAGPYKAAVPVDEDRLHLRFRCCGENPHPQP
ncbi:MAG TPA: hypothetical protein ENJ38_04335 [Rhodospirillales bacterium]|nr:hypothetical protein [Rhodospirillales bacterium]